MTEDELAECVELFHVNIQQLLLAFRETPQGATMSAKAPTVRIESPNMSTKAPTESAKAPTVVSRWCKGTRGGISR